MRKVRGPRGICPECGRDVAVTSDGYIAAGRVHLNPWTREKCAGNGRKAVPVGGKDERA